MAQITFYILRDPSPAAPYQFACRLAEQVWRKGHRVYVHAPSAAAAQQLDELLWTFRGESFVPHARHPGPEAGEAPILIGSDEPPDDPGEVLVNLAPQAPQFHARFQRVAEVVPADEAGRAAGRERYRYYQEQRCALDSHEV